MTVTITGTNFTGATAVSFGGTAAISFTVVSATSITAVVAGGASGNISVTTPVGAATSPGFIFQLPGNHSPVVQSITLETEIHGSASVDLTTLISDADNNLDLSTLVVSAPPISSATVSMDAQHSLIIDYKNVPFAGLDELTIQIFDFTGLSGTGKILVDVKGDIVINNGISPNGDVRNDAWIIQYIDKLDDTKKNHVSLFNRWGDVVYETDNYDNVNHVFNGIGKNGSEVSTGTYFYKIEFSSGKKTKTGYLSLKR